MEFYMIDPISFAEGAVYDKTPLREIARFMGDQALTDITVGFDTLLHAKLNIDEKASIVNSIVLAYLQYFRKDPITVIEANESFYKYLNTIEPKEIENRWHNLSNTELCNIAISALINQLKGAEGTRSESLHCLFLSVLMQISYNASSEKVRTSAQDDGAKEKVTSED